jgi:hypothetical protein
MEQMQVKPDAIIQVPLYGAAKALHPVVFREGNDFCVILGPNTQDGVFGCGDILKAALEDWNERLQDHLVVAGNNDEVVSYVREVMTSGQQEKPALKRVQDFYDQFRPVKKIVWKVRNHLIALLLYLLRW